MNTPTHRVSFQRRLLWALIGVGVIGSAMLAILLIVIHSINNRKSAKQDLETQVRVVAIHSQAALAFDDAETARENLGAFRAAPGVVWAALYDASGNPFAVYDPARSGSPPPNVKAALGFNNPDRLVFTQSIIREGEKLGTVVAAYDLNAVYSRIRWEAILSVAVAFIVAGIAVMMALHFRRKLAQPLHELVATARRVYEHQDYGARARKHTQDEFGDLTDTFNTMLERIQSQQAQLHQRNNEMQQFLYTVSHDLKSPLVTITGFVGIVREDIAQKQYEQLEGSLSHLSRASQHMGALIDNLLELSRIGRVTIKPKRLDMGHLAHDVTEQLRPRLAAANADIQIHPDIPDAWADPVRMRQVVENLLSNAVKYGVTESNATIEFGGERLSGETRYFVRDHGLGIAPEHRKRVFDLFQRLHRSPDGTGVGLTIVSKIIETHQGRFWLEPTPGGGATFWFELPHPPDPGHTPTPPIADAAIAQSPMPDPATAQHP